MAGFHFAEETRYDMLSGRIENLFTFSHGGKTETKLASQRVYLVNEIVRLLAGAGFETTRPTSARRARSRSCSARSGCSSWREGRARSAFPSDHRLITAQRPRAREPEVPRLDREVGQDGRADEVQGEVGRVRGSQSGRPAAPRTPRGSGPRPRGRWPGRSSRRLVRLGRERVAREHQPEGLALAGPAVFEPVGRGVPRDDVDDRLPHGVGELAALRRRVEPELGLQRQGRDALARRSRPPARPRHVGAHLLGQGQQVVGRGRVGDGPPVRRDRAQEPGREDVGARRRDVALLDQVALARAVRPAAGSPPRSSSRTW